MVLPRKKSKCENLERPKKAQYLIAIMFQIKTTDCISQTASVYHKAQNKQLGRKKDLSFSSWL